MHLVSAAAVEFLSDTPALRSPNATLIGQALSSGRLPACSWPAPPNPAAAAPCNQQRAKRRRRRCGDARSPAPSAVPARLPPALRSGFSILPAATRTPRARTPRAWAPTARTPIARAHGRGRNRANAGSRCGRPTRDAVRDPGRANSREPDRRPSLRTRTLRPSWPFQSCPPQPVRPEVAPTGTGRRRVSHGSPCRRPARGAGRNPGRANRRKPDHRPSPRIGNRRRSWPFRSCPPQRVRPEHAPTGNPVMVCSRRLAMRPVPA
jgi:hypothetical protein